MSKEILSPESLPMEQPESPRIKTRKPDSHVDARIEVEPFVEVRTTLGPRSWIRKSLITGVDEVRASSWDDVGAKSELPSAIVHTSGGKSWRISGDAAEFIAALGQTHP